MFQAVYLRMHLHELFELLLPVRIEACGTETSYIIYTVYCIHKTWNEATRMHILLHGIRNLIDFHAHACPSV